MDGSVDTVPIFFASHDAMSSFLLACFLLIHNPLCFINVTMEPHIAFSFMMSFLHLSRVDVISAAYDLDNIHLHAAKNGVHASFELEYILVEGPTVNERFLSLSQFVPVLSNIHGQSHRVHADPSWFQRVHCREL